jgi:hypothetical protein
MLHRQTIKNQIALNPSVKHAKKMTSSTIDAAPVNTPCGSRLQPVSRKSACA